MSAFNFEIIGYIAGAIGFICLTIQAAKVLLSAETNAISLTTYYLLFADYIIWVFYGVIIKSNPVIISNAIGVPFVLAVILKKIYNLRRKIDTE